MNFLEEARTKHEGHLDFVRRGISFMVLDGFSNEKDVVLEWRDVISRYEGNYSVSREMISKATGDWRDYIVASVLRQINKKINEP